LVTWAPTSSLVWVAALTVSSEVAG